MLLLEAIGTRFWNPAFRALFVVLGLGGFLYWIAGIRRLHQVLAAVTGGTYPISPAHATLYHFVPGYNLYWIFRWPSEVARFVNAHSPQPVMPPAFPGFLILGFLVARILLDAALGTAALFGILGYLVGKVREAVSRLDWIEPLGP